MTISQAWPKPTSLESVAHAFATNATPSYLSVPGASRALVQNAGFGFLDWLDRTPPEEQAQWEFNVPRNPNYLEADDGVIRRANDKTSDQKVFCHVRPDLPGLLQARGVNVASYHRSWLDACIKLRQECVVTAREFARSLDTVVPELRCHERFMAAESGALTSLIRIVVYEKGARGYAKPHFDRNGFTFHLFASSPGLYFPTDRGDVEYEEPRSWRALAFPGTQLETASAGVIKACRHGTKPQTENFRRWALLYFAYLAD